MDKEEPDIEEILSKLTEELSSKNFPTDPPPWKVTSRRDDEGFHFLVENGEVAYEYSILWSNETSPLWALRLSLDLSPGDPLVALTHLRRVRPTPSELVECTSLSYVFSLYHLHVGRNEKEFEHFPPSPLENGWSRWFEWLLKSRWIRDLERLILESPQLVYRWFRWIERVPKETLEEMIFVARMEDTV